MLSVHFMPELRRPVLLCAFGGWPDAATCATGALGFLAMKWGPRRFAEFDPDAVYNYAVTRPATAMGSGGTRQLHWPELAFWALSLPHAERDLMLLRGPEPDLLWRRSAEAAANLAQQAGVEMVLTLGGFVAPVSHTAPAPLLGRSPDPALAQRLARLGAQETSYEGPTSFTTAMVDRVVRDGVPGAGLWTAVPSYLRGGAYPKASATLLAGVERVIGVTLGLDELWTAARDLERRVDQALLERPDLQEAVRQMQEVEAEAEAEIDSEPPSSPEELPSPRAVLEDLETFLQELQQQDKEQDE